MRVAVLDDYQGVAAGLDEFHRAQRGVEARDTLRAVQRLARQRASEGRPGSGQWHWLRAWSRGETPSGVELVERTGLAEATLSEARYEANAWLKRHVD